MPLMFSHTSQRLADNLASFLGTDPYNTSIALVHASHAAPIARASDVSVITPRRRDLLSEAISATEGPLRASAGESWWVQAIPAQLASEAAHVRLASPERTVAASSSPQSCTAQRLGVRSGWGDESAAPSSNSTVFFTHIVNPFRASVQVLLFFSAPTPGRFSPRSIERGSMRPFEESCMSVYALERFVSLCGGS